MMGVQIRKSGQKILRFFSMLDFRLIDVFLLFLILFPFYFVYKVYFYTSPDEFYYILTAIQIAEGTPITISFESPLLRGGFVPTTTPNTYISKWFIGQSLLMVLFYLIGGYNFLYYTNAVFALIAVIVTYFTILEITKDRICSIFSSLLLGICPPVVFYSRTLLGDLPSMTLVLLSFFLYLKATKEERSLLYAISSIILGFAILVKFTNLLFLIPVLLYQTKTRSRRLFPSYIFYIVLIPFAVFIGLYNLYFFGNFFTTGYHLTSGEAYHFNLTNVILHFPQYFVIYNIFPPLGILCMFFSIRRIHASGNYSFCFYIVMTFLLFFCFYAYLPFDIEHLFIESTRYLLVILPYLCLFVVRWIQHNIKPQKRFFHIIISIILILGVLNIGFIIEYHAFKSRLLYYQELFYTNTEPDSLVIGGDVWKKLFHPYFSREYGERHYLLYDFLYEEELLEIIPLIDTWMKEHAVYFIDDPYTESTIHDFVLSMLNERYALGAVVATSQPYEMTLFSVEN